MRILFVASRFPYPPIQGDRARGYHQIRILSLRHRLVLATPPPGKNQEDSLNAIRPFCEHVEVFFSPLWQRFLRMWRAPFVSLPLQTLYFFDPNFREKVQFLLKDQYFDVMHVQMIRMAPVIERLREVPKIIDMIDALSLNMKRRAQRERGLFNFIASLEAERLRKFERILAKKYDRLIVSSLIDCEAIGNFNNIHIVPNGVDIKSHSFNEEGREREMIVFTGRMGYFPNADAAIWFTESVFPFVRCQKPNAQFFIVGSNPPLKVRKLAKKSGVIVTGWVPDIKEFLRRATIAVAPMQSGSGMQFKILEAMACGAPTVASPYALGGIDIIEGEHLLVARGEEEFAEKVVRLLIDADLRRRLARNARNLVEKNYTWENSVEMLEDVYRLAITKKI